MATFNKSSKPKNEKAAPAPVAKAPAPVAKAPAPAAKAPAPAAKAAPAAGKPYTPTQEEIQTRAFEIYVSEGCKEGSDLENWLRAEKDLRARGSR
jgi:3-oxoacyl-ACP reductase-like protein